MTDSNKNVLIISHKFLPQPDDDLVLYLNSKQGYNVVHIIHSFSDCPDRISKCTLYKHGIMFSEKRSRDYIKSPEILIYFKEILFTVYHVLKIKLQFDVAVCMDGMCTLFGLFLKLLGKAQKVNYWAVDFVPEKRFQGKVKNFIYHSINKFGYRNADEMWDLSPRMAGAREEFLGVKKDVYRSHKVVPYGMWLHRIKTYSYDECEKNTLIFMGHLLEKQGVQLVLDVIPEIVKKNPDFKFKVIGTGSFEGKLKQKVKDLQIEKHVNFLGKIKKNEDLEEEIAKSCVSIAPYVAKLDTWTKYADPGKIKTYIACGVPVLLTDVPWNAKEIEKIGCGKVITEDQENIAQSVIILMNKDLNQKFRNNAVEYSKSFDYNNIFTSLI